MRRKKKKGEFTSGSVIISNINSIKVFNLNKNYNLIYLINFNYMESVYDRLNRDSEAT